jgi:hypothetical protein
VADWKDDLAELGRYAPCAHHNWHRGGAIWRICDDCGDRVEEAHADSAVSALEEFEAAHGRVAEALQRFQAEGSARDEFVDVVFDGPPGPVCGRFVECEGPDGRSVRVGEWIDRGDGFWALRIPVGGSAGGAP